MRAIALSILLALTAAACDSSDSNPAPTPTASLSLTTVAATSGPQVPPQLENSELRVVSVGERELLLAVADSPGLRVTGLMDVEDLGDLDGMLFFWRHLADGGFWMKDTLIPLDIVWFDVDGAMVGGASMVPCVTETCPIYEPDWDVDYRYAIEANPGDLDWITETTRIVYTD
jgi:uncharacterized membrane protein (UPF0127 family)